MEEQLTVFQQSLEARAGALLADQGRKVEHREVLAADVPFFRAEREVVVKLTTDGIEIWLYDNEVSISVDGKIRTYESPGFDDSQALADAFIADLEHVLDSK